MSTKLENHLYPKGRSQLEPDLMPNVLDSDGEIVTFNGPKRITTEATVVNLGDSPNSNNGDPLRTAFAKINNFIEASYWVNDSFNQLLGRMDSELREGIFIYGDMDSDFDSDIIKAIADAGGDPDSDYHPIRIAEIVKRRYQYSLLDNSSLHFRGKRGQIEVNVTREKGPNNPWAFDSEIHINIGLASTVNLNTLNVNEFLSIRDSDGIDRVTYRTFDYPTTFDERAVNGIDAEFNIGTNVVLGRDSDDVVTFNGRIASNFIPYGNEIYNLGDSDNKWKDLYLSGNTIYLGAIQIKNNGNKGLLLIDSDGKTLDLTINSGVASTLRVDSDFQADGDTTLLGGLSVSGKASFDSDVSVAGSLTVRGTTTYINTENLEVADPVIVLNKNQATPSNLDTGIVFQRYDSDNVSPSQWNLTTYWSEVDGKYHVGQTSTSGHSSTTINLSTPYLSISESGVEFYNSSGVPAMIWNSADSTLKFGDSDTFTINATQGLLDGTDFTIDGGTY